MDPILNPVLNREFQRTGGRTIIRLGSEDIDFSPKFVIIMVTRNPSARFAPDLTSRVTMVNFTVTPASLQTQALSQILRSERPDVDRRRTEVLRLQGEQNVRLRELEDGLLNQLSAVQGNILDDDRVIKTLEELKAEAADVGREVASTAEIMAELKAISDHYEPLAFACSQVGRTVGSCSACPLSIHRALADSPSLLLFLVCCSIYLSACSNSSITCIFFSGILYAGAVGRCALFVSIFYPILLTDPGVCLEYQPTTTAP